MLTADEIRKLVVKRLYVLDGSTDRLYIERYASVIRGWIWVLNGTDPGDLTKQSQILDAINVPYTRDEDGVWIDEDWLKSNNIDPKSEKGENNGDNWLE